MPDVSRWRPAVKFWLLQAALALIIVMLARPQLGTKISHEKRQGIETIIAMDISNSMLAQDVTPSRLDRYKDLAIEQMKKHRIPASITLAQGVLESGAGYSELARKGNNHFGIKCHGWTGRTTYHDDDERNECFRAYDNVYDSYEDHSVFLVSSRRYSSLFRLNLKDYKGWAHGLKSCGYATNPRYAAQLIDIIQLYKLYIYSEARN